MLQLVVKVGNVLPFAPKATYSLGVSYGMALGVFSVTPRADLFKQDTTYFDANNTVEIAHLDPFYQAQPVCAGQPVGQPVETSCRRKQCHQ